jgi:polar amino acid transport system substrate-binding protein
VKLSGRLSLGVSTALVVALVCSACSSARTGTGSPTNTSATPAKVRPPSTIAKSGKIVFCTDISFPPQEFYVHGKPTGEDIQVGSGIARLMGIRADFQQTGFTGIIAALLAHKCDAILSGMTDSVQRRKEVTFIDYINVGQSIMVRASNPKHIKSLRDLAGKTVAVQIGSTNLQALQQADKTNRNAGLPTMHIITFPEDTAAAAALRAGKVDAHFLDTPSAAYYVTQNPSLFATAGKPVNPAPEGLATRKSDHALQQSLHRAVALLYKDGKMATILKRWNLAAIALKHEG